jgi:hypothetical protein
LDRDLDDDLRDGWEEAAMLGGQELALARLTRAKLAPEMTMPGAMPVAIRGRRKLVTDESAIDSAT